MVRWPHTSVPLAIGAAMCQAGLHACRGIRLSFAALATLRYGRVMRAIIILALASAIPAVAAPPPKTPPVSINIKTAADLAVACSAKPVSPGNAALLNFCNGFAKGVVQTERLNSEGSKICLPTPAPKRSATMNEFVTWVKADATRQKEAASAGFISFMSERYPCNKG